jgi:hypothetical protein
MRLSRCLGTSVLGFLVASIGCAGTLEDPARFLDASGNQDAVAYPPAATGDAAALEGSGGNPGSDAPGCPDVPQAIFLPTCTASSCHSSQNQAQGLDLQSPNLASRLVGVPSTEGSGFLIDPSTPSESVLYMKVTAVPPFGARMPIGATPLDDATIACVLAWVTQEASEARGPEAGVLK